MILNIPNFDANSNYGIFSANFKILKQDVISKYEGKRLLFSTFRSEINE